MATFSMDTSQLVVRARAGDARARQHLLDRHRDRLRRMIELRMDRRLLARIDPSDVVQETLFDADRNLDDYLRERPLPFYPWLRKIAWERLIDLHRRHVDAKRRSVCREDAVAFSLSPDSTDALAGRLIDPRSGPSANLLRQEVRDRISAALALLRPRDREILVLRFLEQLSTEEIAVELDMTKSGVKSRITRAAERLRDLLLLDQSGEVDP